MRKHLSPIANSVLDRCAESLDTYVDAVVEEFELGLKPETDDYSRKLVKFCSLKLLVNVCGSIQEKIIDGSFSRLTFDMMLAWENPNSEDEESYLETVAKEKEDRKAPESEGKQEDETSLFYSDLMSLLVDDKRNVGEDAFAWLVSLVPLVADVANSRFAFETLTASIDYRLHFPAYDIYLKEIDKCIKYLRKQAPPKGVKLAEDEFILHVEGTATTQRVVRHIGGTSWPGRLTLTNCALYFEASGVVSYEDALKIDLSNIDVKHSVKAASTGPWGIPLFDKAIVYESSQLSECVVLEFPEMTGSTRRDLWLSITKEVILLHQFLSKFKVESPIQVWEMQARTILGIMRLHAVREMLRISPPIPRNFLIFTLFDELPRGDYVLEELANGLKQINCISSCSVSSILKSLEMAPLGVSNLEVKEGLEECAGGEVEGLESLETSISQVREEAKEIQIAKASIEGLKEEGILDSVLVLKELLTPLLDILRWAEVMLAWERPIVTLFVLALLMLVTYKEWIGYTISTLLVWGVGKILLARRKKLADKYSEILVCTASDQTTLESIVSAQHALKSFEDMVQNASITLLKVRSISVSRTPKHTNLVILVMISLAILLLLVPFKFALMACIFYCFTMNYNAERSSMSTTKGDRRLREWWNSIPVIPVRTVN